MTDVAHSLAFYAAALKPLGWRELGNYDSMGGLADVPDLYGLGDAAYGSGHTVGAARRHQMSRDDIAAALADLADMYTKLRFTLTYQPGEATNGDSHQARPDPRAYEAHG